MNGILKLDNVIPDRLCQSLIDYHKANINDALTLNHNSDFNNVVCTELLLDRRSYLDTKVEECMVKVINQYANIHPHFSCSGDMGYQLREITGRTKEHIDGPFDRDYDGSLHSTLRNISVIFGLNSDYEKGEFHFPQQEYTTTVKRGEAIAFPVSFMYPHSVDAPVGSRYTINTWCIERRPFIPPGTHDD